ncbi:hypothetical protein B296_00050723 [Ensete ventricosum]|uniref:Uncharacterized protein n=1 Tax=Ensete ventricosum TaxID=4639 RepID=A0A426XY04_ENSVE|nr:hypothetical protein B296_00050723 [Ensete ventricosum]
MGSLTMEATQLKHGDFDNSLISSITETSPAPAWYAWHATRYAVDTYRTEQGSVYWYSMKMRTLMSFYFCLFSLLPDVASGTVRINIAFATLRIRFGEEEKRVVIRAKALVATCSEVAVFSEVRSGGRGGVLEKLRSRWHA